METPAGPPPAPLPAPELSFRVLQDAALVASAMLTHHRNEASWPELAFLGRSFDGWRHGLASFLLAAVQDPDFFEQGSSRISAQMYPRLISDGQAIFDAGLRADEFAAQISVPLMITALESHPEDPYRAAWDLHVDQCAAAVAQHVAAEFDFLMGVDDLVALRSSDMILAYKRATIYAKAHHRLLRSSLEVLAPWTATMPTLEAPAPPALVALPAPVAALVLVSTSPHYSMGLADACAAGHAARLAPDAPAGLLSLASDLLSTDELSELYSIPAAFASALDILAKAPRTLRLPARTGQVPPSR